MIGQALRDSSSRIMVLASRKKVYQVFSNPGERDQDGAIDENNLKVELIYEKRSFRWMCTKG